MSRTISTSPKVRMEIKETSIDRTRTGKENVPSLELLQELITTPVQSPSQTGSGKRSAPDDLGPRPPKHSRFSMDAKELQAASKPTAQREQHDKLTLSQRFALIEADSSDITQYGIMGSYISTRSTRKAAARLSIPQATDIQPQRKSRIVVLEGINPLRLKRLAVLGTVYFSPDEDESASTPLEDSRDLQSSTTPRARNRSSRRRLDPDVATGAASSSALASLDVQADLLATPPGSTQQEHGAINENADDTISPSHGYGLRRQARRAGRPSVPRGQAAPASPGIPVVEATGSGSRSEDETCTLTYAEGRFRPIRPEQEGTFEEHALLCGFRYLVI